MSHKVVSGEITPGVLYFLGGQQSVVYNSITLNTGQFFRGVFPIRGFTYTGTGTQVINEVSEIVSVGIEYDLNDEEKITYINEISNLRAFGVEYDLNYEEKIVKEITNIRTFSLELIDYPFFAFEIIESGL